MTEQLVYLFFLFFFFLAKAVKALSLNRWTAKEFPTSYFLCLHQGSQTYEFNPMLPVFLPFLFFKYSKLGIANFDKVQFINLLFWFHI